MSQVNGPPSPAVSAVVGAQSKSARTGSQKEVLRAKFVHMSGVTLVRVEVRHEYYGLPDVHLLSIQEAIPVLAALVLEEVKGASDAFAAVVARRLEGEE